MAVTDVADVTSGTGPAGTPVGRRIVLGLAGLGVAGIIGGRAIQDRLAVWLAPIESRDPTDYDVDGWIGESNGREDDPA